MRDVNIDMKYSCDSYLLVNTVYETRHGNHPFGPEGVSVLARNIVLNLLANEHTHTHKHTHTHTHARTHARTIPNSM